MMNKKNYDYFTIKNKTLKKYNYSSYLLICINSFILFLYYLF